MNLLITILLLLTACIYLGLAAIALFKKPGTPAARYFAAMVFLAAIWATTYAAELQTPLLSAKILFLQIRLIFICFIPFAWLGLVLALTGKLQTFRKTFFILLLIVPTTTAVLALTTRMHNHFRYDFAIETINGLPLLVFKRSHWDMFHEASNHLVSLLGFIILLTAWHSSSGSKRKQTTLLGISFIIPLTANLLFVFDLIPLKGINPTPIILLPSSLIQAYVVLRSKILDIIPVARAMVLDHIDLGILVLDANQSIVDINSSALVNMGIEESHTLALPLEALPSPWNSLIMQDATIETEIDGEIRWIRPEHYPIKGDGSMPSGTLVLMQDATAQMIRERQSDIERDYAERRRQLRLQQLLLRDIHDGLGGLTSNLSYMSVLASNEKDMEKKNEWLGKIERTSTETNNEIREIMNALGNTAMNWGDLVSSIRRSTDIMFVPATTAVKFTLVHVPGDGQLGLTEGMSIIRVVRECLNNVVKHADASMVEILVDITPDQAKLAVRDNGCGYDPSSITRGRGLNNLEKRASELGGTIDTLTSSQGTWQTITIPLPVKISTQLEDEVSS